MNFSVIISESAKQDIRRSAVWYNHKSKGLGKRFTQSINETIKFLKNHPQIYIKSDITR